MDYVLLYISWLDKVVVLKSPGGVDFASAAILDASACLNEERYFDFRV